MAQVGVGPTDRIVSLACRRPGASIRGSRRSAAVATTFGLPLFEGPVTVVGSGEVHLGPGRIILVVGPSGSGKTTALGRIEAQRPGGRNVGRVAFSPEKPIVDGVAPWDTLTEAASTLTACGLGEAGLWLRPHQALSEGERFRARLARAVADHVRSGAAAALPLICDEFCSLLHARLAKAISHSLRKLATRRGLCCVLARCNEDVIGDLQPDTIVRLRGGASASLEHRTVRPEKAFSLRHRVSIEPGRKCDYRPFAPMHYRPTGELGFVDKVFVMRERGGDPLGIVVYSHGPLELSLRNRATAGWFSRNPQRVNRHLRILRRLVIHPDVRGCGLGHYLVRKTLGRVGTEYVECLASMGEFNPVFERAGMKRIGRCETPRGPKAALAALEALGVDPDSREFVWHVGRRRRVRQIVASVVRQWYAATTGGGERRADRQSPSLLAQLFRGLVGSRPVYYLWRKRGVLRDSKTM